MAGLIFASVVLGRGCVGWISCMFDYCLDLVFDLVRLAIGSWSPLELAGTWVFLGIVIGCWCTTSMEFYPVLALDTLGDGWQD